MNLPQSELRELFAPVRMYTIPDLARVRVPKLVGGVPGKVGPFQFTFPTLREITGIQVVPADGNPAWLADLSLEILDENSEPIFFDQIGDTSAPALPFAMPLESLLGMSMRPFPLRRLVCPSDRWTFTIYNSNDSDPIDVAAVGLFHREVPQ